MSPFHPIEPIPAGIANGRRRARRAVPTAKGERRLWVQLGDFRRKAQQWGGCADSGPSRPRPGMRSSTLTGRSLLIGHHGKSCPIPAVRWYPSDQLSREAGIRFAAIGRPRCDKRPVHAIAEVWLVLGVNEMRNPGCTCYRTQCVDRHGVDALFRNRSLTSSGKSFVTEQSLPSRPRRPRARFWASLDK